MIHQTFIKMYFDLNAQLGFSEDMQITLGKDTFDMFRKEAARELLATTGQMPEAIDEIFIGTPAGKMVFIRSEK